MHDVVIRGRHHRRWHRRARLHRRRRPRRRPHRPGRRQGRAGAARGPGRGPPRHPRLGRCPYPLRRPGDLGPGARAVLLAWRHHHHVRQLRRRLRPGAEGAPPGADRPDGGRRGHPRHRPGRGAEMGLGELPGIPRRAVAPAAHHRRRGADRPPPLARLCMGERAIAREMATAEDIAADGAADRGSAAGRRLRLHHLAAPTSTRRRPATSSPAATPTMRS